MSLIIAVAAAVIDMVIGMSYGLISGYFGGKVDMLMQRFLEVANGIPRLVIVTLLLLVLQPGMITIIFALMLTEWVGMRSPWPGRADPSARSKVPLFSGSQRKALRLSPALAGGDKQKIQGGPKNVLTGRPLIWYDTTCAEERSPPCASGGIGRLARFRF